MRYFKTLRTVSLIISLVMAVSGCATGKNRISPAETTGLKAEAVAEGICLTFENIPPEAKRLFIHFQYLINEETPGFAKYVSSYSDLREGQLEQVKQTGKVLFPIVQEGREYSIAAIFHDEDYEKITDWIYTDCIANKGISLNGNLTLSLNESKTSVTLSSEPVFSSEVVYDKAKYNFGVTIMVWQTETESSSIGVGSHHISDIEGLTWIFDPEMTNNLREGGYLESGSYPAYVTARCNIIYNNITWSVQIAKTPEFTYSF